MNTSPTTDMENLMGDLGVLQEELKWFCQIQEEARLFAEKQMPAGWNRADLVNVTTFYNWMIEFIFDKYIAKKK